MWWHWDCIGIMHRDMAALKWHWGHMRGHGGTGMRGAGMW